MNEFRASLADQATKFVPREETEKEFQLLKDDLDRRTAPNYTLIGLFSSILFGGIGAAWLVLGLRIEAANVPVLIELSDMRTSVQRLDRQSSVHSDQILASVSERLKQVTELKLEHARIEAEFKQRMKDLPKDLHKEVHDE